MLRFIVEETLAGNAESISEYVLGVRVFNRGEDFNPRTDPIVRVQAHHLRSRLAQYYSGPGAHDPVRIELPPRTYVPVFRIEENRAVVVAPAPEAPVATTEPAAAPVAPSNSPDPQFPPRNKIRGPMMVTAIVGVLAVAGVASFSRIYSPARGAHVSHEAPTAAKDLYIRGRYLLDRQTETSLRESIESFHQAISRDPQYAAAYAGLADAYNLLAQYGYMPPPEAMEEARRGAQHALLLDPRLAEGHVAMAAIIEAYDWNWQAAEREYRRAIELDPALPEAHLWYGMFLRDQNRLPEAMPELRRAEELQPLSVLSAVNIADGFLMSGDSDAALDHARRAVELDPELSTAHLMLAHIYRYKSDPSRAEAELDRARELSNGNPHALSLLACAYVRLGNRPESVRLFGELQKLATVRYVSPFDMGSVALKLGNDDQAVNFFEDAFRQHSVGMIWLRKEKSDSVTNSPRMKEFISRIHVG